MNTVIALAIAVTFIVIVEFISIRDPRDKWWTITGIHQRMPKWIVAIEMLVAGMLIGHFWM